MASLNISPDEVVAAARRHIDEPYRHLGRTALGRDCLGLLLVVLQETGQIDPDFDYRDYTEDASGYLLEQEIEKKLIRLSDWREARPADILLQKFHANLPASHIIIISQQRDGHSWGIHASRRSGRCLEQIVAHEERNHAAFRLPGVATWHESFATGGIA